MVVSGELDPDASRASRLTRILQLNEQGEQDLQSDASDVDDTELVSIHSQIHRSEVTPPVQQDSLRPGIPLGDVDEYTFVAHKLTGTVHVIKDEQTGRLACGRRRTINMDHVEFANIDAATAPFCIQCNAVMKA